MIVTGLGFGLGNTPKVQADEKDLINIPGNFSTTLGIVTDYRYRGLSQTDRHPAIQGSFDWSHESGFYLGVWGSNVDFQEGGTNSGNGASTEFDWYGGYGTEFMGFSLDAGVLYYTYPGAANGLGYDFVEYNGHIGYSWNIISVTAGINYSPEFFALSDGATYSTFDGEVDLGHNLSVIGHWGHQEVDNNATYTHPDYNDWSLGAAYSTNGFDFKLLYVDTDIEDSSCGVTDACDSGAVFSISRSF